jgi:hypothetical protein
MRRLAARYIAGIAGLFFLLPGLWAFFWPQNFATNVATFPPFSRHLVHDMGSFQIGIGVAALAALVTADALTVAFAGAAVGAAFSGTAHILDWGLGGRSFDPIILYGIAALMLVGIWLRRAELTKARARLRERESAAVH